MADDAGTSSLTSKLAKFNPLSKKAQRDEDDVGEEIDETTVAGGGHAESRDTARKADLRVSSALKSFLASEGIISEDDMGAEDEDQSSAPIRALLSKPHIRVPHEVTDRSHPLTEYFISSSHNTYLMGHQLTGKSSASAYETALRTGSRCVEIDAWDNDDNPEEPKVTHGYTLVSNIPFRAVCETIRDVVDRESTQAPDKQGYHAGPIMLSLENHCKAEGQRRLVQIMKEVFGDRLLSKAIRDEGTREQQGLTDEQVTLAELGSKIVLIVEYHFPDEPEDSSSSDSDSSSDEEEERAARAAYKQRKKGEKSTPASSIIIPDLADLGVYAQSVKPRDNSWFESLDTTGLSSTSSPSSWGAPHHHLINVSETGLSSHLPGAAPAISRHNARHLMRVFPKGTRIGSRNLSLIPFWSLGAQICALNWQTFGASMQLNDALFAGSDGYVLKPKTLRAGGSGDLGASSFGKYKKLSVRVAGATGVPPLKDAKEGEENEMKPYVTCSLTQPSPKGKAESLLTKRKTKPYKQHKLTGFLHGGKKKNPPPSDPIWDETLVWEGDDVGNGGDGNLGLAGGDAGELAFLRILVKSDESFAANPILACAAVRVSYLVTGQWRFVRMLDLGGRETGCTVLVKVEVEE